MSTGFNMSAGQRSLACFSDMADLTPTLLASYEHEATAPLVMFPFCSSVIITPCGFPASDGSLSSSHDAKNASKSTHIIILPTHFSCQNFLCDKDNKSKILFTSEGFSTTIAAKLRSACPAAFLLLSLSCTSSFIFL